MTVPPDTERLSEEVLAAWIDRGLSPEDRAKAAAHLVDCDECRALVVDTRGVVRGHQRPIWRTRLAVSGLAAAAALLVVASPEGILHRGWFTETPGSDLPVLVGIEFLPVYPSFGRPGETLTNVRILGSGFDNSARASWRRNDMPDPAIQVLTTRYISPTEVQADIVINASAVMDQYDVAVTLSSGRQDVIRGTFEVTTARLVGSFCPDADGFSQAFDVNDGGVVVGLSCDQAFVWEPNGRMTNLGDRVASGVDEAGRIVVGQSADRPVYWTRLAAGRPWSPPVQLPANGWTGRGNTILSDANGAGWLIGGRVDEPREGGSTVGRPVLWFREGADWRLVMLPRPAGVPDSTPFAIFGMSHGGRLLSRMGPAAVWEPEAAGSDQYTATLLPGNGLAFGISPDGTLIVGMVNRVASYWRRSPTGGWADPVPLHEPCVPTSSTWANDANDHGIIVGRGCAGGAAWRLAPGGAVDEVRLPGLGQLDRSYVAWRVNNSRAARAAGNGTRIAVYWDLIEFDRRPRSLAQARD